jgi:peptide/nickel transport system permease protein
MELTSLQQIGDLAWHLVLPIFCMTYGSLAALSRYMRTGLLDVIRSDYVRTARAKGLPEWQVIGKHAVRNGLIPVLTLLAGLLPAVLGGSVIIEVIFDIPGMGLWMIDSIYQRDYNVIMVIQLFATILTLVGILLTDLSYALVDPRIRYE